MSSNQTKRTIELLNRQAKPGGGYQIYAEEGRYGRLTEAPSAFVLRGRPPLDRHEKPGPNSLVLSEIGYQANRQTGKSGFSKRSQQLPQRPPWPGRRLEVVREEQLLPHAPALQFYLNHFLRQILRHLEVEPRWLKDQAKRLEQICAEEQVAIPFIEAFEEIDEVAEFAQLLEALIQQDLPHKLELALALVRQFAIKFNPP